MTGERAVEGEVHAVSQSFKDKEHQPECPLAHDLINKLSVVVGNCELLMENTPADSPLISRMKLVLDTARSMAADLAVFQCELIRKRCEGKRRDHR